MIFRGTLGNPRVPAPAACTQHDPRYAAEDLKGHGHQPVRHGRPRGAHGLRASTIAETM